MENLVLPEIGKKLKEHGFSWTGKYYESISNHNILSSWVSEKNIPAPGYNDVLDWIYSEHNIHIILVPKNQKDLFHPKLPGKVVWESTFYLIGTYVSPYTGVSGDSKEDVLIGTLNLIIDNYL